jgi:iron complex outermembrane recepter protein
MNAPARSFAAAVCTLLLTTGVAAAQSADPPAQSTGAPPQAGPRPTIDELMKIDVTSVQKHAEPAFEAAAAISILLPDDIRRAGITTLPEALRLAAGVAVGRTDGHTWAISARGFDISTANKMVVMMDGRSIYTPLFAGVLWDVQDVVLEDVDRIEVVRGPGASLWGANAVNGVINVITKRASETKGTLVQVGGGSNQGETSLRYGGAIGKSGAFRVYGKGQYQGPQLFLNGASAKDPLGHAQVGTRIDLDSGRTSFTIQSDAYLGKIGAFDRPDTDVSGGNVLGRLTRTSASGNQLQLQWYYDYTYRQVPRQFAEARNTGDVDLQYRFVPLRRHDVTAGAGLDVTHSRTLGSPVLFFDPATRTSPLVNTFAQDVIEVVPQRFYVTVGSKFEHNDYTGFEAQPTGRFRWSPARTATIWGAVSRGVRMPARFDTDLRFTGDTPNVLIQGNPDFLSETVIAHELGYRQSVGRRFAAGITGFENDYDHLRSQEPTLPTIVPIVLSNLLMARTAGFEFTAAVQPSAHWDLRAAYAFLWEQFRPAPGSLDPTVGSSEANDPAHQLSIRSMVTLPRHLELDATVRSIGRLPHPVIPGYTELTVHVGLRPNPRMELALIGDNLLHPFHQEASTLPNPEVFVRSVLAQLTWRR